VKNRLEDADRWLAEGHVEAPLTKADHALERLENGSKIIADAVATDGRDIPARIDRWNARIVNARKSMIDAESRLTTAMQDTREGMNRMDKPVEQVAEVMAAINNGEGEDWKGTLGRLVNEPTLADDIEDATTGLKEATESLDRFKAWLGARVELNAYSREFRFYATAELRSRNDQFYLIELERSGLGVHSDTLTDSPNVDPYTRREVITGGSRFTAQFGKRFGRIQLRGGLKDSTFGVGVDLLFMDGRLKFESDVFGSYYRAPRMKFTGMFAVFRSLYILAGIDDALNPHRELTIVTGNTDVPQWFETLHYGRDFFGGVMLQFNDEDLSTLLRLYGALLVGLL
jgi:phospholipid/cholesterol/gamma-HCH transport system substrate-binding protein